MEAMMDTEIHAEPPSPPKNSIECVNESPDTVAETTVTGIGASDSATDAPDPVDVVSDREGVFEDADKATDPPTTPDDGEIDDSDDESVPTTSDKEAKAKHEPPPTVKQLEDAMEDLEKLLKPPRSDKHQNYKDPNFDPKTIKRLEAMKLLCFNVLELEKAKAPGEKSRGIWTKASVTTARSLGHSTKNSIKPGKKKAKEL